MHCWTILPIHNGSRCELSGWHNTGINGLNFVYYCCTRKIKINRLYDSKLRWIILTRWHDDLSSMSSQHELHISGCYHQMSGRLILERDVLHTMRSWKVLHRFRSVAKLPCWPVFKRWRRCVFTMSAGL